MALPLLPVPELEDIVIRKSCQVLDVVGRISRVESSMDDGAWRDGRRHNFIFFRWGIPTPSRGVMPSALDAYSSKAHLTVRFSNKGVGDFFLVDGLSVANSTNMGFVSETKAVLIVQPCRLSVSLRIERKMISIYIPNYRGIHGIHGIHGIMYPYRQQRHTVTGQCSKAPMMMISN